MPGRARPVADRDRTRRPAHHRRRREPRPIPTRAPALHLRHTTSPVTPASDDVTSPLTTLVIDREAIAAAARTIGARRCRRGCACRSGGRSGRGRRDRSRGGCRPLINAGRATNWAEQARPLSRPGGVCLPRTSSPPTARPSTRVIGVAGPTVARYTRARALPVWVIAAGRGTDGPGPAHHGRGGANAVGVAVTLPDWPGHRASRA